MGFQGVFPLVGLFNVIGGIIISFVFGWKLALVVFCSACPAIILAAFIRVKYDLEFEERNNEVFQQSAQFATEAMGAIRTVLSLTMEDSIIERYSAMLQKQINHATKKAVHACAIFALSDSLDLCAMALTFW
jgi:ATP-binding cassette, subfamily B (MDR/TAP), member 1